MQNFLTITEIVLAILLTIVILLQQKGSGLGAVFGGEGNVFRTKRGLEKKLHHVTIILSILFIGVAIAGLVF